MRTETGEVTSVLNVLTSSVVAQPLDSIREFIPERNPLNVMSIRTIFGVTSSLALVNQC